MSIRKFEIRPRSRSLFCMFEVFEDTGGSWVRMPGLWESQASARSYYHTYLGNCELSYKTYSEAYGKQ